MGLRVAHTDKDSGALGGYRVGVTAPAGLDGRIERALERRGVTVRRLGPVPARALDASRGEALHALVVAFPDRVGAEAVELVRELGRDLRGTRVVVVAEGQDAVVRKLLRAGACGFVRPDDVPQALGVTVEAVCVGQTVVPLDLRHHAPEATLSQREKQILAMVVMGYTNGEIATRFYLAESTVKSHLSAAFRKLGVRSRKDAAALILDPDVGLGTGFLAIADDDGA